MYSSVGTLFWNRLLELKGIMLDYNSRDRMSCSLLNIERAISRRGLGIRITKTPIQAGSTPVAMLGGK